ncbi:hypothetical protein GCM10010156_18830 [Planobispora rosea]|uniref:Uncharacterized protein n=1 Tax=Planobispora rosea TaxID=35762 RepID=A0A8J3WCN1_PLARO|nr:hypothetical protein GCM10010156_18830 [Planobispora rosea]GIH84017.1 hypothetical protein Pro02_24250 [Planobispora rosea]
MVAEPISPATYSWETVRPVPSTVLEKIDPKITNRMIGKEKVKIIASRRRKNVRFSAAAWESPSLSVEGIAGEAATAETDGAVVVWVMDTGPRSAEGDAGEGPPLGDVMRSQGK